MHEAAAAMPNPTAPPNAAIRMPVMDGPIMRPACQGIEPSAIAFGSRSRSISWGMSAMRLGSSKARKALLNAASTSRCSRLASPKSVRAKAADSVSAISVCVATRSRRRLMRSARTPPKSWKRTSGTPCARPRYARDMGSRLTSQVIQAKVMYSARCPRT